MSMIPKSGYRFSGKIMLHRISGADKAEAGGPWQGGRRSSGAVAPPLPPHRGAGVGACFAIVDRGLALERAVERGEDAPLGEVVGGGLAIAWPLQLDCDLGEDAPRL